MFGRDAFPFVNTGLPLTPTASQDASATPKRILRAKEKSQAFQRRDRRPTIRTKQGRACLTVCLCLRKAGSRFWGRASSCSAFAHMANDLREAGLSVACAGA